MTNEIDPTLLNILLHGLGLVIGAIAGGWLAVQMSRQKTMGRADRYVDSHVGRPCKALVRLGRDGKWGVEVGKQEFPPEGVGMSDLLKLQPDWITSVQDRKDTAAEAVELVRRYWPRAMIVECCVEDHPDRDLNIPRIVQGADYQRAFSA